MPRLLNLLLSSRAGEKGVGVGVGKGVAHRPGEGDKEGKLWPPQSPPDPVASLGQGAGSLEPPKQKFAQRFQGKTLRKPMLFAPEIICTKLALIFPF